MRFDLDDDVKFILEQLNKNGTKYFRASLQNKNKFGNELFYKSTEKMIERTYLGCNLIWMMM